MRVAAASALIVLWLLAAVGGSYWLGLQAIGQSQHNWCGALTLLTKQPVPRPSDPAANPSRENTYLFYVHLKQLERKFGC
jgi:hypothetical protein